MYYPNSNSDTFDADCRPRARVGRTTEFQVREAPPRAASSSIVYHTCASDVEAKRPASQEAGLSTQLVPVLERYWALLSLPRRALRGVDRKPLQASVSLA